MEEDQDREHPTRNLVLSVCDLKQHGDVPPARCGSQTVTMGTRMYLHGGADERQAYNDLHLLEIEQMKWTELTGTTQGQGPSSRYGHTIEGYNTDLVLFGGLAVETQGLLADADSRPAGPTAPPFVAGMPWTHSGVPDNALYVLQTQNLTWKEGGALGTPPSPRFFHGACVHGDFYVIFGGCGASDYSKPLGDVHMLDLRSMQWSSPACSGEAPPPRFSAKIISKTEDDSLMVFGGASGPGAPGPAPGVLYSLKVSTGVWSKLQIGGTPPNERAFHTFDLIGKWGFVFAGSTSSSITDLYILDVPNNRWARPLYEGQVNVRAHASSVLHDKLIVFGGVRDKASGSSKKGPDSEQRISKKLFFLNVLEVKGSVAEGDFKFKLVTVGDSGVGKSCLLTRFVQDYFSDFHASTIGVDFKTVITMVKGRLVKLQLWDTAGQERFSVVTGNYYRNSDGFIFVFDATNRASFDHVEQWLGQVQQHHDCGPTTIKILVGNKFDLVNELVVSEDEARAKAEQLGAFFISTSAKTAANVDMAFLTAAQQLVETRRRTKQQPKTVQLGSAAPGPAGAQPGGGKKCCAGGGGDKGGAGAAPRR
eukprot:gnl/TRDRNA2_/TRDRNA2_201615_c0_seq1.p1 gnl/TRDRNA2_/TRDRNA2_201615_c0~~gnl/TRDRNA2_/TRDRNA2_201615_c0_seq1.p1  ORF type:complete len:618 (-),score=101.99 gnl/TRDRNA2_/TRDRNA2_201615_c0_seq1:79-1854(-)